MVQNQVRMGALKDGQTGFVKVSGDGTSITKKDTATVTTVTIGNEEKALQIGTLAIVLDQESYEVNLHVFLDASTHLYKRLCPSVRRSVRRSVRGSVGPSRVSQISRKWRLRDNKT